jgi:hypothetical protein
MKSAAEDPYAELTPDEENELAGDVKDENRRKALTQYPDSPSSKAFYGLLGEIAEVISPHTEADPVALLAQSLVIFGNMIGRNPYFMAEADAHYMNLFIGLVGITSKGRKGTSLNRINSVFSGIDDAWFNERNYAGLSSGEGLIWAVRDPIEKMVPVKEKNRVVDYQAVIEDHGIEDKRILVVESEFESVLRVLSRDGNTLSALIRQAWEKGNLRTMTKNSPARATGAHVSIIGHITRDGLRQYLDRIEVANGFANRFVWFCVRRANILPEGGHLTEQDIAPLRDAMRERVEWARSVGELHRNDEARSLWSRVYTDLSEGKVGLLGAVLNRAEAQVTRLSCIYALADMSYVVRREHLEAALALWEYSEASARFIFGDAIGNPTADAILKALRSNPKGLTRTDIRDLLGRNKSANETDAALFLLTDHGLARMITEKTAGRPIERWFAV